MSLRSCELNNNFNEVAGCLNARLNRAYILPLPSVSLLKYWLGKGGKKENNNPPVFRKEYRMKRFCRNDAIATAYIVFNNRSRIIDMAYLLRSYLLLRYCLQSAMGSSNLRKCHNTPKSILARTQSWCAESTEREDNAFGRRIKRFVTSTTCRYYYFLL